LITDHKPLTFIFNEQKDIPIVAATRLQRWALHLAAFRYEVEYRPGHLHANADALSRLPLPSTFGAESDEDYVPAPVVSAINRLETSAVTSEDIVDGTTNHSLLSKVMSYVCRGWPNSMPTAPTIEPFWKRRDELSVHYDLLFWGDRVVIPPAGHNYLLAE